MDSYPKSVLVAAFNERLLDHPDSILIEAHDHSYSYADISALADWLNATIPNGQADNWSGGRQRTMLLADEGKSITSAIYLAAVLVGIAVIPISTVGFQDRARTLCSLVSIDTAIVPERFADQFPSSVRVVKSIAIQPSITRNQIDGQETALIDSPHSPNHIAYVIMTSGSTGAPKLVPITHSNLNEWARRSLPALNLDSNSRFSSSYRLSFDASNMVLFGSLVYGARNIVPSRADLMKPLEFVRNSDLTHWASVPSALVHSYKIGESLSPVSSIQVAIYGGETVSKQTGSAVNSIFPNAIPVNAYGPSETTIFCATGTFTREELSALPLNQPTIPVEPPPMEWWLRGESGAPADNFGELYIAGRQCFGGYLPSTALHICDDAELLPDPFPTGDYFTFVDGLLYFSGRRDNLVKIRGQRTSLEYLESIVKAIDGVSDAGCLLQGQDLGSDIVVLYTGDPAARSRITGALQTSLPSGVKIHPIIQLLSIPTTENGKLDRGRLARIASEHEGDD